MSIKSILLPLGDPEGVGASLALALPLARRLEARISAMFPTQEATQSLPLLSDGLITGVVDDLITAIETQEAQRVAAMREHFEALCAANDVVPVEQPSAPGFAVSFFTRAGMEDRLIARQGRVHDLVVMTCPPEGDPSQALALQAALLETGRPLLITPTRPVKSFATRVMVAWNGSIESARALGAASEVIAGAETVLIATVEEEGREGPPAEHAATYLDAHGIAATVKRLDPGGKPVAEALLDEADALAADLVVMGAYSHSRLRESVLGGVTRDILVNLDLPVLMMH